MEIKINGTPEEIAKLNHKVEKNGEPLQKINGTLTVGSDEISPAITISNSGLGMIKADKIKPKKMAIGDSNMETEQKEVTTQSLRHQLDRKNHEVRLKILDELEKCINEENVLKNPAMVASITELIKACKSR